MNSEIQIYQSFDAIDTANIYHEPHRLALIQFLQENEPVPAGRLLEWGQYNPDYGYYQQNDAVMKDEYTTSPEHSHILGKTLSQNIWTEIAEQHTSPLILIAGDGTGRLTAQCLYGLKRSQKENVLLTMVDRTEHLLEMQQKAVRPYIPEDHSQFVHNDLSEFLNTVPDNSIDYAQHNELLDELTLRFYKKDKNGKILELYARHKNNSIAFDFSDPEMTSATQWFFENFSQYITTRLQTYQPDAVYITKEHVRTLKPGGRLTMIDYYKKGPTHFNSFPVLGWNLFEKINNEPITHDYVSHEKGLGIAVKTIGLTDITVRVDQIPLMQILKNEGDAHIENQFTYLMRQQSKNRDKLKIVQQAFWHANFSVISFTKSSQ